jgi:hypothetical protein
LIFFFFINLDRVISDSWSELGREMDKITAFYLSLLLFVNHEILPAGAAAGAPSVDGAA